MFGAIRRRDRSGKIVELPHDSFIRAVYRGCLDREPDEAGFACYLERLRAGTLSWEGLIRGVLDSPEYKDNAARRQVTGRALLHLHECRKAVFRRVLPAAEVVVDLGGASNNTAEGALFDLGYPYAPRQLTIVDLPPGDRVECTNPEPAERLRAARGTDIRYVYGSMTDLGFLPDGSVDLVVSGQSIEHVSEPDAGKVCLEVHRVLRPGGHFCLDTPNARLTRLQSPVQLIHPEHKREYRVSELREQLTTHGFTIHRMLGICAMEDSAKCGRFDYAEMTAGAEMSDDPEIGYAFYIDAVKA